MIHHSMSTESYIRPIDSLFDIYVQFLQFICFYCENMTIIPVNSKVTKSFAGDFEDVLNWFSIRERGRHKDLTKVQKYKSRSIGCSQKKV